MTQTATSGEILVVQPGESESFWQPVPANGHIEVLVAPHRVAMDHPFALGTQSVAPGGHVREHAHDRNEELVYVLSGAGHAVLDGEHVPMRAGSTIFLGKNRRHMFVNDGAEELRWVWLIVPNGLEDFFRAIGRPRQDGEPAPAPFPRPADVLEIERRTVFAAPTGRPKAAVRLDRLITVVGAHAEGEGGRVITGGVLPPRGATMFERMENLQRDSDWLRGMLLSDPRGGVLACVNLITPPTGRTRISA